MDVKPANVLRASDGSIRLGDFGLAVRVPATQHRRTLMFAAPEMIATGAASTAADAWSYGVLVYTLLVGFPPFFPHAGGHVSELKEQVRAVCMRFVELIWLCVGFGVL